MRGWQRKRKLKRLKNLGWANCLWCGKRVIPEESSLEHVVPASFGGDNKIKNLALAHAKCNADRADNVLSSPDITIFQWAYKNKLLSLRALELLAAAIRREKEFPK